MLAFSNCWVSHPSKTFSSITSWVFLRDGKVIITPCYLGFNCGRARDFLSISSMSFFSIDSDYLWASKSSFNAFFIAIFERAKASLCYPISDNMMQHYRKHCNLMESKIRCSWSVLRVHFFKASMASSKQVKAFSSQPMA